MPAKFILARRRWRLAFGLASLALAPALGAATPALDVGCGVPPTVNGKFADGEWARAARVPIAAGAEFLAQRADGDLFAAVRLPPGDYRYVDLYVRDSAGRLLNLHASFEKGQRLLAPGWDDSTPAFEWSPSGWEASIAGRTGAASDAPIAQQIGQLDGYEMRIPIALLGAPPLTFRLEVRDFEGKAPDWTYPAGSTRTDSASWAPLRLPATCR